jgi:FAD dependent oxidoreductase TIGR03364
MNNFDIVIVGSGIMGLACAYHASIKGLKVAVIEKDSSPKSASVQNFGLVWPIGQKQGEDYTLALESRKIWLELSNKANFNINPLGSLHLAYYDDEWNVLQEYFDSLTIHQNDFKLFKPKEILSRHSYVNPYSLKGALFSPFEMCLNPYEVILKIIAYLKEQQKVHFYFNTHVIHVENNDIFTLNQQFKASQIIVCSGNNSSLLFNTSSILQELVPCKLQMMKSIPYPSFTLKAILSGGLTLRHYKSFSHCISLKKVKKRIAEELPEFDKYGIHVIITQNNLGELIIGDSHEYGDEIDVFNKQLINEYILNYLKTFFKLNKPIQIQQTWNGMYMKHLDKSYVLEKPQKNITILNGLGGNGMTLSLALSKKIML